MVKNYSLKDAFKALDEINDEIIETSIVINGPLNESLEEAAVAEKPEANIRVFNIEWDSDDQFVDLPSDFYLFLSEEELADPNIEEIIVNKLSDETGWLVNYFDFERIEPEKDVVVESKEKLTEETFSLSDDKGLKDIEEFQKEEDIEQPELTVVDTNADEIDEVASNDDAAGSFVFTCDKCGENIFRTLDELKTNGYERIDDTLFKLKNKDVNMGEFYHCTKCGNDTFTGNKQIVLADVDSEVEGKPTEEENSEVDVNVADNTENLPDEENIDIAVEESLQNKELKESFSDAYYEKLDKLAGDIETVLDNYGILWGDIVDNDTQLNIVGIDPSEWEEAQSALKDELGLDFLLPDEGEDELVLPDLRKIIEEKDEFVESANLKEGFKKIVKGQTYWSKDGEEWEECTSEEYDECGYKDITEPEDEFDEVSITDIEEESLDKAISEKMAELYENFASYKTETAILKDVENRIILEGNLKFTSNKEQPVKFILEAIESDNANIKFKLTCEDFSDFESELKTKLTEGLLEADEASEEDIVVDVPHHEIVNVTDKDGLKHLYDKWAMTWEGLRPEDFQVAIDYAGGENAKGYLISGKLMNEICHLTGDNAYPDDLNIFAVYPFKGLAMQYGARWMADIIDNNARREDFHPFKDEHLDEASSAEKRSFRNGGQDTDDLIQGKAIARIKNADARNAAVAALKAGRPEVAQQFIGDRKDNQAARAWEKKATKMQKAGLSESDEEWKDPEDCSTLEEYDTFGLSDLEYSIRNKEILEAENITEDDERDWAGDADGYVAEVCSIAAWGGPTSNKAERRLLVDYIARNYPSKLKVLRKYLGNENSSVDLDYDVTLECKEEK